MPATTNNGSGGVFRWMAGLPRRMRKNAGELWEDHRLLFTVLGLVVAFVTAFFWRSIFIKIGPGEEGVIYHLFLGGTDTRTTYGEGLHVIFPWDTMYIYNMRLQQVPDSFFVLSEDGLAVKVDVSIRFNPIAAKLGRLHKEVGPDYVEKVVKPEVQAQCRYVIGQYKPDEIYTSQGFIFQTVAQGALGELGGRYIALDGLLFKSVTLPGPVAAAIESKLRAQQLAEEYTYRLQTADREAQRKQIEATGIRDFQLIVGEKQGTFDQYLSFRGIEATLALAQSANARVVIAGSGKDHLPLIFDGGGAPPAQARTQR